MHYEKKKREQFGRCNICGNEAVLKWDHVPPRSCENQYPLKMNPFFNNCTTGNHFYINHQNGVKFRTLCENCNSGLLGTRYDPTMKEYTQVVEQYITSELLLPPVTKTPIQINKLCRAIVGHYLSTAEKYVANHGFDQQMRQYVLNDAILPPKDTKLLTWVYPYIHVSIARGFAVLALGENKKYYPSGYASVVSAFPCSYVLTTGDSDCGLIDLFSYCTTRIEDYAQIPIVRNSWFYPGTELPRDPLWPINIADDGIAASGLLSGEMGNAVIGQHSDKNIQMIKQNRQKQL